MERRKERRKKERQQENLNKRILILGAFVCAGFLILLGGLYRLML